MGLYNVVAIEVGQLPPALHPDLVLAVLGQVVKAADVESELAALGELANEDPCRQDLFAGDISGHIGDSGADEEYPVLDEAEDGLVLSAVDHELQGVSDVLVQLGEEYLRFSVSQWPHQQSINNSIKAGILSSVQSGCSVQLDISQNYQKCKITISCDNSSTSHSTIY